MPAVLAIVLLTVLGSGATVAGAAVLAGLGAALLTAGGMLLLGAIIVAFGLKAGTGG